MYFRKLEIENTGPIKLLQYKFSKNDDGSPKPVILVGKNGTGKSIVLSHLVSALLTAQSHIFEDADMETGKVFKLRSSQYISYGCNFLRSRVEFDDDFFTSEIHADRSKKVFEEQFQFTPCDKIWNELPENENSIIFANFHDQISELKQALKNGSYLYFPPNRFEEPAWLNELNLNSRADFTRLPGIVGKADRKVVKFSPLDENQNWLLDIIYDCFAVERRPIIVEGKLETAVIGDGQANRLITAVSNFMNLFFQMEGKVTYEIGNRGRRRVSIVIGEKIATRNLFCLSTGETILLNIFLSLLRDTDLSKLAFTNTVNVQGIVVVDEVDLHLHTELQYQFLPELIALFPKVQFILTSHSPLFLMGMKNRFGADKFDIINLPMGEKIDVERFSEFEGAYNSFKASTKFEHDIKLAITKSQKPKLYVEGTTDIDYIERAATLLGKKALIAKLEIQDGGGSGGLNRLFKNYNPEIMKVVPQKIILLYDCDTQKQESKKENLFVRVIPKQENKVSKGIENLFPDKTIRKAIKQSSAFIDIIHSHKKKERGVDVKIPTVWQVNSDEKRNLCDWLIKHGSAADFEKFKIIFAKIEAILGPPP